MAPHPLNAVQDNVEELRQRLHQDSEEAASDTAEAPPVPIWQLPVQPLLFEGDVNQAKALAKTITGSLPEWESQ